MLVDKLRKPLGRHLVKALGFLVLLSLLLATLPGSATAAKCKFKYKVQAGDTLIYVANLYKTDWREIAEANDITEPYVLVVDTVLCIPDGTKPTGDPSIPPSDDDTAQDSKKKGEPVLEASQDFSAVHVAVKYFPKNTTYYVKVADYPSGDTFYRIGRMRTDKNGTFNDYFKLPKYVLSSRYHILCVKDVITDEYACDVYTSSFADAMSAFGCGMQAR